MLSNRKRLFWVVMAIIVGVTWQGCVTAPDDLEYDNPLDPTGDDYVPPITTILTAPSDTITTTTTRISWSGSHEMQEFAYRLDDRTFSTWSKDTSVTLDYLDEGEHLFEVKSRYPTGVEEDTPAQVDFIVDAVPPQSLLLYPYCVEVAQGDTFSIELQADEITGLTVLDCTLEYDTSAVIPLLNSVKPGPFLAKDGGSIVQLNELRPYLNIVIGVTQGPVNGVSGSGVIVTIQMKAVNTSTIQISDVDLRGPNDEAIELTTVRGSPIEIGE